MNDRNQLSGKLGISSRLLKHADFQDVYQRGKKYFSGNVSLFYRDRGDAGGPRVGFAVGRMLGNAVERNRIKRRLRAAVQRHLGGVAAPLDIVVHPRKAVLTVEFSQLAGEVERSLSAIRRVKAK